MEKEMLVQLINKAKSGDQQAFEELLKEAHTPVSYQCRKMLDNEQDVEDATQEILLTIYTKLDTLEEPAAFYGWLGRITANQCKNALRKHKDLQFAEDEDGNSVLDDLEDLDERQIPDKALDNAETARMIDEIVSQLPEAQRMTTLLFYYNEMSIKQIAEAMDIKEDAVKARLFNARKTIKAKVQDYEKQGIKLYSVSVLPLLWYFLRKSAQAQASGEAAAACAAGVMGAGATAAVVGGSVAAGGTAATGTATVAAGTAAAATATAAATAGGAVLIGKIAIGAILVAATTIGAVTLFSNSQHEHDYTKRKVEATCEDKGYTKYTCSCGDSYRNSYVPALGHDFGINGCCVRCGEVEDAQLGTICCTVTDSATNTTISGVTVSLTNETLSKEATTDSEGVFQLSVPAGQYVLTVEKEGYARYRNEIEVVAVQTIQKAIALIPVPEDAVGFEGRYYKIFTGRKIWDDASQCCLDMGGHLATITSEAEQQFVLDLNSSSKKLWIGGFRDSQDVWQWVTGENWDYTYWEAGEPNNSSNVVSNENCVAVWPQKWNDLNGSNTMEQSGYICEWDEYCYQERDLLSDAYTAYEAILKTGSAPDSNLTVCYYAYLDVDHNGIPELIVADSTGTPEAWSIFEVYTYDESGLRLCGESNARYTYLTYVNDKYILGTHRMGAQYIGVNEHITTTVYLWNEEGTRNDPAISINGGDWEYITQEEFDYYNDFDAETPAPGGFVETIEIITLQYNTYRTFDESNPPSTGSTSPSSPEATEHTHDYAVEVVAPTCTENGYTVYICKCGDTYTDNAMAATGHTYTAVVTPPTETAQGYTTHICACGASYVDSYTDPVSLIASGTCGENLMWQLEEGGLLTIWGTGNMTTCSELSEVPWYEYRRHITAVVMQDGVSNIGEMAFYDCDTIYSVAIPESVIHIGEMAFAFCEGLTGIRIPDSVINIGNYAFMGCSGLISINIPEKVTSIGNSAFIRCAALERITIPNSVTSIGDDAFHDCFGLTSITIPDSVISIGNAAFRRCTGLSSITIPSGVTSIAGNAFEGCTGLTSISVDSDNMVYHSSGNCIIQTSAKELVIGCKTSAIPADGSVICIGDYAFSQCSELNSITLPDGITYIGQRAFANCSGLTSIRIPDGVTSIGYCAFSGCTGLSSITIPASVSSISPQAFAFCSGLTRLAVEPDNTVYHSVGNCIVKTDTKTIIAGCDASIIPTDGSVTSIGDEAFWYCEGLTSITIPDSITSIGRAAFYGCSGLTSITFEGTTAQWNALEKGSNWDYSTGDYTIYCTDGAIPKFE